MSEDIQKAAISALRNAAKEVLNDLAEAGPAWSGEFRDSWYVETTDGERGVKVGGDDGKYNLFNIPLLSKQGRSARGQFTKARPPSNIGSIELLIGNFSPYAQEAMDLIPGKFIRQESDPIKAPVDVGVRFGKFRGDVRSLSTEEILERGKKPSFSTAEPKWYDTYMGGGAFSAAVKRGARAGFIRPVN
jgi:hypothetical protein